MDENMQYKDFMHRNKILKDVEDYTKDKVYYSQVEKLIMCMIIYKSNSKVVLVEQFIMAFKVRNSILYNEMLNEFLELNIFNIYKFFIIEYELEFQNRFYSILNKYLYSDMNNFKLIKRYKLTQITNHFNIVGNLSILDSKVIQPIVDYHNKYNRFRIPIEVEIQYIDNTLINLGYATTFKLNLIDTYEVYENLKTDKYDIDFSFMHLMNDDFIFISTPDLATNFDSSRLLSNVIIV